VLKLMSVKRFRLVLVLFGVLAAIAVAGASGASFESDHPPCMEPPGGGALLHCPTGTVGKPYSVQLRGNEGCNDPSLPSGGYYWWEVINGALPAGLTMTPGGVISGIPQSAGEARFWLRIHDLLASEGGPAWCTTAGDDSEREHSISIDPGLSIVNQTVKAGTIGEAYSETLTAKRVVTLNPFAGTDVQATWSLVSGSLPPGVTLSSDGLLAGTPSSEGSYQFVVQAQNEAQSDTETLTINVRQPLAISSSPSFTPVPPKSELGVPLSITFTPSGGSGTFTWAPATGTLPRGVSFDPTTGTLSGTPRAAGRFPFSLTLTDSEARTMTVNATLAVAAKLVFKTLALKPARVGRLYTATLKTLGGVAPMKWKITGKLPRGIRFAKKLGVFTGTAKREGTYRVSVQVTDALGVTSKKTFILVVKA
jgi:Putative Ig domain